MHPSNPPPLNTSFSSIPPSKRTSVVFEPYALHMIASVIRDLQFLRQQGYISFAALEEIIERLPKPVVHAAPHTPPAPSPSSSPIPQPESPTVSIKSDISQKRNSNTSITQRPPSTSSQNLQQQREEQSLHSLAQGKSIAEEENQNQQLQQKSARRQSPTTTPQQVNTTPPPLQNSSPPSQSQLPQNDDDDVVNAGQPQLESIPKPAVPSRASVYQPVSPVPSVPSPQSSSNISPNTISGTGAILATRPLPLPPNAPNSSPPRPQPLPIFDDKYEEVEYEKSINQQQQLKDTILPAYSLSIVEAMWDFVGDDVGDLSFKKGDIVEVVEYVNVDWWKGRIQGTSNVGIFPRVYTKILNTQVPFNQVIPDQPISNNTAYYNQRLPQHSNNMSPYSSQHYQLSQSPSQLPSQTQHQQLPPTQQQLPPTQQNTYTTYQHHPSSVQTVYDSVYANHASNVASQHHYLNTRSSTTSLNNQQQYYKYS